MRAYVWIGGYGSVQRIEYQPIAVFDCPHIGNDATVVQIQNGAQICLVDFRPDAILELCYIRQPFTIWRIRMKLSFQIVLGSIPVRQRFLISSLC